MENEDLIQQLIETRSFDSLSDSEREIVLSVMSKEEYISRGEVVKVSKDMLNKGVRSMTPSPLIKSSVAELMEQRKQEENKSVLKMLSMLFTVKIPAYQFVLGIAILLFILPPLVKNKLAETVSEPKIIKELAYVTDTVYIEKEVQKIVEVEKIKYIKIKSETKQPAPNGMEMLAMFEEQSAVTNVNSNNLDFAKEQFVAHLNNIGQSAADREELNQFIVAP